MKRVVNNHGFARTDFTDSKGVECSVQVSSAYVPSLWIGVNNPDPVILHKDAKALGINTSVNSGWVPYPMPKEVLCHTRMHLSKPQLREFINELEYYYSQLPDIEEE